MTPDDTAAAALETAMAYDRAMVAGDEGAFQWIDLEALIDEAKGLVGQHGAEGSTLESLRIDGDIASMAIRGRYAGLRFLDHLAMVRVDGRRTITAKTFDVAG